MKFSLLLSLSFIAASSVSYAACVEKSLPGVGSNFTFNHSDEQLAISKVISSHSTNTQRAVEYSVRTRAISVGNEYIEFVKEFSDTKSGDVVKITESATTRTLEHPPIEFLQSEFCFELLKPVTRTYSGISEDETGISETVSTLRYFVSGVFITETPAGIFTVLEIPMYIEDEGPNGVWSSLFIDYVSPRFGLVKRLQLLGGDFHSAFGHLPSLPSGYIESEEMLLSQYSNTSEIEFQRLIATQKADGGMSKFDLESRVFSSAEATISRYGYNSFQIDFGDVFWVDQELVSYELK